MYVNALAPGALLQRNFRAVLLDLGVEDFVYHFPGEFAIGRGIQRHL